MFGFMVRKFDIKVNKVRSFYEISLLIVFRVGGVVFG